jgi:hypothetical protein
VQEGMGFYYFYYYFYLTRLLDFAGCFFSTAIGELRSFENPKNKITAVPAKEEEIWGATFKVIN